MYHLKQAQSELRVKTTHKRPQGQRSCRVVICALGPPPCPVLVTVFSFSISFLVFLLSDFPHTSHLLVVKLLELGNSKTKSIKLVSRVKVNNL